MKSVPEVIDTPLGAALNIGFDVMEQRWPRCVDGVLDVRMLDVNLIEACGLKQMLDVPVAWSTSLGVVDGCAATH